MVHKSDDIKSNHATATAVIWIVSEAEAARRLNLGQRTLQEQRLRGTGPRFIRLGSRRIGYDLRDLDAGISARRVTSTSATCQTDSA